MDDYDVYDDTLGDAASDAAAIIGSIGQAAAGNIKAYGDAQGDQYKKVADVGATGLLQTVAIIAGAVVLYKLLSR
jgi:hypothetical protein